MSSVYKLILATSFLLIFFSCSTVPERDDGVPFSETQYRMDDMNCRSDVKKRHPYLAGQVRTGESPNSSLLSLGFSEYHNCMTAKGWKNF
ncbi:MAG: hypothetical protein HOD90_07555 [Nitrospina sp.]|jgi:hypothetical protein|nr:hypothetical protein [Nitrospina sp.]